MGDIEAGLTRLLGNYTEEMAQWDMNVLDANGKLRDMGQLLKKLVMEMENMSENNKDSLSQTMAGTVSIIIYLHYLITGICILAIETSEMPQVHYKNSKIFIWKNC